MDNTQVQVPTTFESDADFAAWLNANPAAWNNQVMELDGYRFAALDSDTQLTLDDLVICFEQPQDAAHIIGLVAYWHGGVAALPSGEVTEGVQADDAGRMFAFSADMTKSARDDIGEALPYLTEYIDNGTPIRKTNRAGEGTQGTRKYEAVTGRYWMAWR